MSRSWPAFVAVLCFVYALQMSIDLRVGGPRHGVELGKAKHNKISDEDEVKNGTYLPLLLFSAFRTPSVAEGVCSRERDCLGEPVGKEGQQWSNNAAE